MCCAAILKDDDMQIDTQTGVMSLPKMEGVEISPGIFLIGEPRPIEGTSKLRCLANVNGSLAMVELNIKFAKET